MFNAFSLIGLVAFGFWMLVAWLAGWFAKSRYSVRALQFSDWARLRARWAAHRSEFWDQGGLRWSWQRFQGLHQITRKYGLASPDEIQHVFSWEYRRATEDDFARVLRIDDQEALRRLLLEMLEQRALRFAKDQKYCLGG